MDDRWTTTRLMWLISVGVRMTSGGWQLSYRVTWSLSAWRHRHSVSPPDVAVTRWIYSHLAEWAYFTLHIANWYSSSRSYTCYKGTQKVMRLRLKDFKLTSISDLTFTNTKPITCTKFEFLAGSKITTRGLARVDWPLFRQFADVHFGQLTADGSVSRRTVQNLDLWHVMA